MQANRTASTAMPLSTACRNSLIALALLVGLTACEDSANANPATHSIPTLAQAQPAVSERTNLSVLGKHCVSSSPIPVSFEPNEVTGVSQELKTNICSYADQLRQVKLQQSRRSIDSTFCELAKGAADSFGNGDMQEAHKYVASMQNSKDQQVILKAINICSSTEVYNDLVYSILEDQLLSVYSVGEFNDGARTCKGFLSQTVKDGFGEIYELYGIGACHDYVDDTTNDYHPIHRPDAVLAGDRIRSTVGYTGIFPATFHYKGHDYSYASANNVAAVIKQQTAGISVNSPVLDLRDAQWPIQTPMGSFSQLGESLFEPKRLMLNNNSAGFSGSSMRLLAYVELQQEQLVLLSDSEFAGNTPMPINLHLLSFTAGKLRQQSHLVDITIPPEAHAELEQARFTVTDSAFIISFASEGQYTYSNGRVAFKKSELAQAAGSIEKLVQEHSEKIAHMKPIEVTTEHGWVRVTGRLHAGGRGKTPLSSGGKRFTVLPQQAYSISEPECTTQNFSAFTVNTPEGGALDHELTSLAGQEVELELSTTCHPRSGIHFREQLFKRPKSAAVIDPSLLEGHWHCQTSNPDSRDSQDRYWFSGDGTFTSSSGEQAVSGEYTVTNDQMALNFKEVVSKGKKRKVDAHTSATIRISTDELLEFSSIDASTEKVRYVKCTVDPNPPVLQAAHPTPVQKTVRATPTGDYTQRYARNIANQMHGSSHPACGAIASHIMTIGQQQAPENMRMRTIERLIDKAPSACF